MPPVRVTNIRFVRVLPCFAGLEAVLQLPTPVFDDGRQADRRELQSAPGLLGLE